MRQTAVFFDIDGTLWNSRNEIPESTVRAIHQLQDNGHLAFINTGRSRAFVRRRNLLDIGFDGIVSACGTMIEINDQVKLYNKLSLPVIHKAMTVFHKYHYKVIMEGRSHLYLHFREFKGDPYGEKLISELADGGLLEIDDYRDKWEVSKFSCDTRGCEIEPCRDELKDELDFLIHTPGVVEMVPKGFTKGTGIIKTCELTGIDPSQTVAFGDSVNDLDMLRTAGVGVAMGNGTDAAKKASDYVTTAMEDDGIEHGLKHLGLI